MKKWIICLLVVLAIGAIALGLYFYNDCKPINSPESTDMAGSIPKITNWLDTEKPIEFSFVN